jgi:UDP-N-acetylglucosamine 3-dehydrogenase
MRIGILGAGNMGRTHAAAYAGMPGVTVAAIVARHETSARELADQTGAAALTDPQKLLEDASIDAVDVCYPTAVHREYVVTALEQGKHVFCETPIALTVEDADAMIEAAHAHARIFGVGLLIRFVSDNAYIHEVVTSGALGEPLAVFASRRSAPYWSPEQPAQQVYAEPVIELGHFDFDFLNWLLGLPSAVLGTGVADARGSAEYAFVSLEFERARALVEVSAIMPRSYPFSTSLRVVCEGGALETTFRLVEGPENTLTRYPPDGSPEVLDIPRHDPYQQECTYFVRCVRGEADPSLLSPEAARDALRVALAARDSVARGGERVPLE